MFSSSVVCVGNVGTFNGASYVGCIAFKITCYGLCHFKKNVESSRTLFMVQPRSSATVC